MKKRYSAHKDYQYLPRPRILYRLFFFFFLFKYRPYRVEFEVQPKPKELAIYISNHCQAYGPIIYQMYWNRRSGMPVNKRPRIWATSELVRFKEAYKFFKLVTVRRSKRKRLWKFLSAILSPIAVFIFRGGEVIPVYRSDKISITHQKSVDTLREGRDVIVLPENPTRKNDIIHYFNIGFVDVAKKAYEELGIIVPFYPMYLAPNLKRIQVGKPIYYNPNNDQYEERVRIINYLEDAVTELGRSLPEHKVIYFK